MNINVDVQEVINSLTSQLAQAHTQIAVKDATIKKLQQIIEDMTPQSEEARAKTEKDE